MLYKNRDVKIRFPQGPELSRGWLEEDAERAQRVLTKHRDERPLCGCTPVGVLMHVVCRQGKYYLATMPGRSHHHAMSCPAYTPDPVTSALRHYSDLAFSRAAGKIRLVVKDEPPTGAAFDHFTPTAALECLWELAGLNICTPKTVRARNLFLVAQSLAAACEVVKVNDVQVQAFTPPLRTPLTEASHVIGAVRSAYPTKFGYRIKLVGDPSSVFWVNTETWALSPLSAWFGEEGDHDRPPFWIFARLWRSPKGYNRLFEVGGIEVNTAFLPVHAATGEVIEQLVHAERRFFLCPRLDATHDRSMPVAVLLDLDEPQNLYSASLAHAGDTN